ncbi:hypothetical protein G9A89_005410 [Geosiphon pyriformis]|nr:hypothetical protein G9A89_005410 [Geosiphon pyriformis]
MNTNTQRNKFITLEEWESKTQLSETQKQSILDLQDLCSELPLPEGYANDVGTTTPQLVASPSLKENLRTSPYPRLIPSPLPRSRSTTNLLVELAAEATVVSSTDASLGIPHPIETTQQFFDWFAKMETDMEKDQEDVYRNFLATVTMYRQACDNFLNQIGFTVKLFHDLDDNFRFVEERTKALQTACEKLLEEQNHLEALADLMSSKLSYYNELESITSLFNSLGENICEKDEFVPTLARLDECLEYMQGNLRYRDSELYLLRFRQCMTRGMTLIKINFIWIIKGLGMEISKKTNQTLSTISQKALFYGKFLSLAPKLKIRVNEIEKRCPAHREYASLLSDCYNAYFSVRQQLLIPVIVAQIQDLSPGTQDILTFTRNGYGYMKNLCLEEYSLFYEFFTTGEDDLYGNLDLLCSYLYDELRPRIIHEAHIDTLSEMCTILQDYAAQEKTHTEKGEPGLQFSYLIKNVLQDTQQRLVFRAQTYIDNNIKKFVPEPSDLDYPDRLKVTQEPTTRVLNPEIELDHPSTSSFGPALLAVQQDNDSDRPMTPLSFFNVSDTSEEYRNCFTTLQRTLWILSKLYRCVNTSIFDDIAQDVVLICLNSLLEASENITKKNKIDGQLFLIKHLLILKERTASFETQFVHEEKDLDFSEMTDALNEILQNKYSILSPNTLIGLAQKGMPKVVGHRVDAKLEVDKKLKQICEEFILGNAKEAVESLSSFLLKVSAFRLRNDMKPTHQQTPLKHQSFAQTVNILEVYKNFRSLVQSKLQFISSKLSQYLDDRKTETVLLRPLRNHIIESYQAFYDIIELEFDISKLQNLGSIDNVKIWVEDQDSWPDVESEVVWHHETV